MNRDVDKFLESSLLEDYILGTATAEESRMVEDYIATSEEVRKVYVELQENIEWMARKTSVKAPEGLKDRIMSEIDTAPLTVHRNPSFRMPAIAASILALVCSVLAFNYWSQNRELANKFAEQDERINNLLIMNQELSGQIAILDQQKKFINDPDTERFVLNGNKKADGFVTLAYWNTSREKAYVKVEQLPELETGKCLQMWADVDGKMISVGILPDQTDSWVELNYLANAESLNITIEPLGGSEHPTVSDLVANVII